MSTSEWRWPGARWWKCDLHVHTPTSHDFKRRDEVTHAQWVEAANRSGVQVIAVTDHNASAGIEVAREGAQFVVFPGVELTVSPGVHLLALFDPSAGRDVVTALLGKVNIPADRFGDRSATSPLSVEDALSAITNSGGLCIAAHVDRDSGLLREVGPGLSRQSCLKHPGLAAVEVKQWEWDVPNPKDETKPIRRTWEDEFARYVDGSLSGYRRASGTLTLVTSSDAHDLSRIGTRTTWVKMTRPSIEGLRLALADGAQSARNDRLGALDPNGHAALAIESIEVNKARHLGHGQPFEVRFNPWLSTIIGGRGAGKSTLVELLRATLRRESELPKSLREEWSDLVRVPEGRGAKGILRPDTTVAVVYRKDGVRFRVQWDPAGTLPAVEAEQPDGTWARSTGSAVTDRFPIRIYSQKQVYELTREPHALLRIVDEAPDVDVREWRERWSAEEARFLSLRAQAREVTTALAEEPRVRGELEDARRKLAVFEAAGHAAVLKTWQSRQRQGRVLQVWEDGLSAVAESLRAASVALEPPPLDETLFDSGDPADGAVLDSVARAVAKLDALRRDAAALADRADAVRADWVAAHLGSAWAVADRMARGDYDALVMALRSTGTNDPSEYGRLVQQRQVLEARTATFEGRRVARASLRAQAEESLSRLQDLRLELTRKRAAFLDRVLHANPHVRIEVIPFGGVGSLEPELRRVLGREDDAFRKDIGAPGEAGTLLGELVANYPSEFERGDPARRSQSTVGFLTRLTAMKQRLVDIAAGTAPALHSAFARHMASRPAEQMDRLDVYFPHDSLLVSFKALGQGQGFQPITQGSPGQRSAALLAFLLSYGEEPIVLDQPEDDLDNHLVYDLIVKQLRLIKQRRQVIVVTHNANIVVNGDAELVVALDVRKGQAFKSCEGGLQEEEVRGEVCRIMEGGREAFRERYRRIARGDSASGDNDV